MVVNAMETLMGVIPKYSPNFCEALMNAGIMRKSESTVGTRLRDVQILAAPPAIH
jgi:hypothetical protein